MQTKFFGAPLSIVLLVLSGSASAGDIRNTPIPDHIAALTQLGYGPADAAGMLSGSRDELWAKVPRSGWTSGTFDLQRRMFGALGSTGFDEPMANVIINMCKVYARDPRHCVIYASSVACAESSCGASWKAPTINNNIFGLNINGISFASRTAAAKDWIKGRYNNNWFTANEGYFYNFCKDSYYCGVGADNDVYFFYSDNPKKPANSRYCMSEFQPDGTKIDGYCPNGYKNAKTAYLNIR